MEYQTELVGQGFFPGNLGMHVIPPLSLPKILQPLSDSKAPWAPEQRERGAAVAVLFIPPSHENPNSSRVVLIVRSTGVPTHKGQVAFAGGKIGPQDVSPGDTAVRELHEELGISPAKVQLWGSLPPLLALDNAPIVPVLMTADLMESDFIGCEDEVAEIIFTPWTLLAQTANLPFKFNLFGNWRESDQFRVGRHTVWGLTAKIIRLMALS